MGKLSHVDEEGRANMVDVGDKACSNREARASGFITLNRETIGLIKENHIKKGDVLTTAEIAGIQAAKQTALLIPLCHLLLLTKVEVHAVVEEEGVRVTSFVRCIGQTGVEMEALTAVSIALLTIYDMCKAVDKQMVLREVYLVEKIKREIVS